MLRADEGEDMKPWTIEAYKCRDCGREMSAMTPKRGVSVVSRVCTCGKRESFTRPLDIRKAHA